MNIDEFTDEPIETGLVTATVTAPGLTPAGKEAAKALLHMKDVSLATLAQLARDIAQDIYPLSQLLNKHGLTNLQYEFLLEHNEFFKRAIAQETKDWQSIASTEKRIRLQALAALEDKLPIIANRMGSAAEKLGDVVEAAKLVAKVAGVDTIPSGSGGGGAGFTITIDLGADTRVTIGPQEATPQDTDAPGSAAIPKVVEGKVVPAPVQNQ